MRGAWGKPYGTVARVNIGQIIMSIRAKETNSAVIIEALRRARYKFPGRQKIIVSKKWGFTNVSKDEYLKLKEEKRVMPCVSVYELAATTNAAQRWCLCTIHSAQGSVGAESAEPAACLIDDVPYPTYRNVRARTREAQGYSRVRDNALYSLRRLDNGQRIGERGQRMKRLLALMTLTDLILAQTGVNELINDRLFIY